MRLDQPNSVRAEMARRGILPTQLRPYEDPERGYVDPYLDPETRTLVVGFLAQLNTLLIEAHDDQHARSQTTAQTGRVTADYQDALSIGTLREAIIQATELEGSYGANMHESKDVVLRIDGKTCPLVRVSAAFIAGRFCLVLDGPGNGREATE